MPLARILTFLPEDATPLVDQLHRLGFQVEVANPNDPQLAPADLEIEFAVCDQQQVLARAAAIAAQLQAEVVVFPGALPPLPKPTPVIAEVPVSVDATREIVSPPPPQYQNEALPDRHEFELQLPAETRFDHIAGKLRKLGGHVAAGCSRLGASVRSGMQRLKPVVGSGLATLKTRVSSTSSAVANRTREYQERIKLRAAEARVARKQRLAEIARQRTEAADQASSLQPQQPDATATRQEQLQSIQAEREKRLAEMDRLRAEAREQVAALERARLAAEAEHQLSQQQHSEQPVRQRRLRAERPQPSQLRGVLAGAAAASVLFIVGILLANFHAITPLSNTTNSPVEQQTPFGATTVHGAPGVTVGGVKTPKAAPVARSAQPAAPQLKPHPATSAPVEKKKSQWRRFRQRSNRAEGDATADDVVVRHYASPQKPVARNTQQQAGLKRYSDQ